jgi:glutamate-5-semialdehyde dehydrogenase
MDEHLESQLRAAKVARRTLGMLSGDARAALVLAVADEVESRLDAILEANSIDVAAAEAAGMSAALIDRLRLNTSNLAGMVADIKAVAALPDPLGKYLPMGIQPSGLHVERVTIPLGVVGVVYESRPNVTTDITALCLRSGNAVILRGGSETLQTNRALTTAMCSALGEYNNAVQFIDDVSRERVRELICADKYIDVIIPRGGAALGRLCAQQGTVPVIVGGAGVCHIYIDKAVDADRSVSVVVNAKTQKTSVCNALDTVLVHEASMKSLGCQVCLALSDAGVTLHASDRAAAALADAGIPFVAGKTGDLETEWLSMNCNVVVVPGIDAAIEHIAEYGSHSDGILSDDADAIARFIQEVDSPAVFVNASTRFHDGGQFGLGAEVAVSTQKVHARGPLGLEALTSCKWIATGDYLVRS